MSPSPAHDHTETSYLNNQEVMHSIDESREALLHAGREARTRVTRFWDGFANWALRDNVLEVAVGLIVAAAFTKVVSSFVSDIILPIISLLPFLNRNIEEKFAVLRGGPRYEELDGYMTQKIALEDGALILAWGTFLNNVISFFTMAGTLYCVALLYTMISKDAIIKKQVKCRYCRKYISEKAQRCVNCSSWQDGREDIHH